MPKLDEDSQAFLDLIKKLGRPPINALPPDQAKEVFRRGRMVTQPDLPQVDRVKEYSASGPHGPIPVRFYRGAGTADMGPLPCHIYYHGGGWVLGDLDSHDWVCRKIANGAQCAVLSVDYRMAPEYLFPAAFEDSLAAVNWAVANAGMLKIDAVFRSAATVPAAIWQPPSRSRCAMPVPRSSAPRSWSTRRSICP
jgi:acetyl esterase